MKLDASALAAYTIFKRSHDARKKNAILFVYAIDVELVAGEQAEQALLQRLHDPHIRPTPDTSYHVVAAAPATFQRAFSTTHCHRHRPLRFVRGLAAGADGVQSIILERGKAVRERTQDTWGLWRNNKLNPESNVQFGEGGAGTFSDGKLYSQVKDPKHYGRKVMQEFIKAGAPEEIIYVARPHIGTFRLVGVVEQMRQTITALGGEIRFQHKVEELLLHEGKVRGVRADERRGDQHQPHRAGNRP